MKDKLKKHYGIILLAVIIVVELIYTTFVFAYKKQGVHSDEMWTYGSANSYYRPQMYVDSEGNPDNLNKWISGELLHDYITVQKGEQFSYGSVYSNLKGDLHPPLYYMLVHTVCSFFPEKFSFWYAYAINFVALIVTQIFLYKLVMLISKDKKPYIALLACLLYGGGVGALSTFIFLRMYAMAAALATANIYYQLRLFLSKDFDIKHNIFPIAFTGLLGLLSHNLFAFIMGLCTACICLWLLFNKKIKKMFIYGFSMLGVVGVFCAIFPYTLMQAFRHNKSMVADAASDTAWSFGQNIRFLLGYITWQNTGISMHVNPFKTDAFIYISSAVILLIVIAIPLCFLFRKEEKFIKLKEKVKAFFLRGKAHISNALKAPKEHAKMINFPIVFLFVIIIGYAAVGAKTVDVKAMGDYGSRYVMPVYPLMCAAAVVMIQYIAGWIPKLKKYSAVICTAAVVLMLVKVNWHADIPFLNIQPKDTKNIAQLTSGKKCQVVVDADWHMVCYQYMLQNCSQVKFSQKSDFYDTKNKTVNIDGIEENQPMYLIINTDDYSFQPELKDGIIPAKDTKRLQEDETVAALKNNDKIKSVRIDCHIMVQGAIFSVYRIN